LTADHGQSLRKTQLVCNADSKHGFKASEVDWGFADFVKLTDLTDKEHGFLWEDGSLHFKVSLDVDFSQPDDSKRGTGIGRLRKEREAFGLSVWHAVVCSNVSTG
jgi:hypothetical protein